MPDEGIHFKGTNSASNSGTDSACDNLDKLRPETVQATVAPTAQAASSLVAHPLYKRSPL